MDDKSVDRILAATVAAERGDKIDTNDIDNAGLRRDLESVKTIHLWAKGLGCSSPQKERNKRRSKIAKKAGELRKLLHADRDDDGAIGMFYPRNLSDYIAVTSAVGLAAEQALKPLEPLINGCKRDFQRAEEMFRDALTSGSPFEASIATLMFVFEKHLETKAGYTKKANEDDADGPSVVDSPFVGFAEQTLQELGITKNDGEPHTRQAISTAITHARKGGRRKYLRRRSDATDKS